MWRRLRRIGLWVLILAFVGALASVAAIVGLFTSVDRRPLVAWSGEVPSVADMDFLRAIAGATGAGIREGGQAQILSNGEEFLPTLLADLRAAERTIDWTVYVWRPGIMSEALLEAMTERARAGVEVRVVLDDQGTEAGAEAFEPLRRAGGRVERFRPPRFAHLSVFHKRNHRRAIVIDGQVGFTGGAAVADTWLGDADRKSEWRDDMVRVTGALVPSIQAAFSPLWAAVSGEVLSANHYVAEPPPGEAGFAIGRHVNVVSAPSQDHHPVRLLYWMSFSAARERIWITNPYVVPDESLCRVLEEKAREGVDVRILTAGTHTDLTPVRWAAQHFYERMLDAGIRIYEFQPALVHSKRTVVDGIWSILGSPNLDIRSLELNLENALGIQDAELAGEMERLFERDLADATEITAEEWRERSLWVRVRSRVSALAAEQL